ALTAPTNGDALARLATSSLSARLAALPLAARRDALVQFVSVEAAAVLGAEPGRAIATDVGLFEMGMDSLMSVELRKRLERGAGIALPSTLTFNYPNIDALATFLELRLVEGGVPAGSSAARPSSPATAAAEPPPPVASDVAELSDDELEARLLARLEALR
ncbi:MAG: acyl carrier protein, partial [Gemmatimonadaceae bacterium]